MRRVKLDTKTQSSMGPAQYPDCIVCGKAMMPSTGLGFRDYNDPPSDGTYWETWGNFGSTVFDDPNPTKHQKLSIHICDPCLVAAAKKDRVLLRKQDQNDTRWEQFKPGP